VILIRRIIKAALTVSLLLSTARYAPPVQAAEEEATQVPILMYHKVSKDMSRLGKFTVSPGDFEADLQYLRDNGYTTLTMADLIAYVQEGVELPKRPVVLTFDDGAYSDYLYVFPLLQVYEMKAVISIIGRVTDEYSAEGRTDIHYPHLIWDQIREMVMSGCIEIQNHGYDMHHGCGVQRAYGETGRNYEQRMSADLTQLQTRALAETGVIPNTFTYPFGGYNTESEELLRTLGFSASLICEERVNLLKPGDDECLFGLGRILRPHNKSAAQILQQVKG